jgi:hypothetical protein
MLIKAALSGVIVLAASEVARRSPTYGALLVSLPLVSILAMIWLWHDTGDSGRIAALSEGTFWLVLPTLPMFLVLPMLLRQGVDFWLALAAACALTVGLYSLAIWLLPKLGIGV